MSAQVCSSGVAAGVLVEKELSIVNLLARRCPDVLGRQNLLLHLQVVHNLSGQQLPLLHLLNVVQLACLD